MGRQRSADVPRHAFAESFATLLRDHYLLLYRTAFGVTGSRTDADEVMQSLFVTLLQNGFTLELRRKPVNRLHRAVVDLSINVMRVRARQTSADVSRERDEFDERLITLLARLKPRALEILILHYKHGYGDAQIAALLGTSSSTIAVTLSRLRARLKQSLRAAGRSREDTTPESIRRVVNRLVPSPSDIDMAVSRDWILQRVHSLPPQLQQARMEDIAAVISWWRTGFPLAAAGKIDERFERL